MRALGSDFWVDVPAKRVKGARLLLFNHELAARLGLDLPSDQAELEKLILEKFAWVVAQEGEPFEKKFIATRYQDSATKDAGAALGDGRAFWTGELEIKLKDGRIFYVDITAKGIGQTPLAWFNHTNPLHKDGLQSTEEAVHSFTVSEVNLRNNLDSTGDLAVIEIPTLKMNKLTNQGEKSAITIRVGNQTRVAHYRYFSDSPANFKTIFEYAVTRDLGLPLQKKLEKSHIVQYLDGFAQNLGEEAARYYDLDAVHTSPTPGNRTTRGATIDLGTFRYLDAHHSEYSYNFDRIKLLNQTEQLEVYIDYIFDYARQAKYPLDMELKSARLRYESAFKTELTNQWLHRLGLDEASASKVNPALRDRFFRLVKEISETVGTEMVPMGGTRVMHAAAYEPREILRRAMHWKASGKANWNSIFTSKRNWATPSPEKLTIHAERFGELMNELFTELHPSDAQISDWQARAEMIGSQNRLTPAEQFSKYADRPAMAAVRAGKGMNEITEAVLKDVDSYVDLGLVPRPTAHLGQGPRIAIYAGTFDPPHLGHEDLLARMKEAYQLSDVIVFVHPTSDHKTGVTDYAIRKEMTAAAFAGDKHVRLVEGEFEKIVKEIHEKNPTAEIFQIMGDDRFFRLQDVLVKTPHLSGIIVNPRVPGVALPSSLGDIPVLNAERVHAFVSSSMKVRTAIASGNENEVSGIFKPSVLRILKREKLYKNGAREPCSQLFLPEADAVAF